MVRYFVQLHVAKTKSRANILEAAQKYDVTNIKIALIILKTSLQPKFLRKFCIFVMLLRIELYGVILTEFKI